MIDHYNAFISYRHAPEDIKVAETVQRELEHFHIPYKIRKKTGMKRIQQIFRDKDELPITSNLTDTISNALLHSDYLIVICSTNTKESIWVQREIEFFLRNHTRQQILTVLVNGEPQDVIPEILTYEETPVMDYQGRMQMVRTPLEPLSCDYRMSFRKAKKVELPRLASALIGCSYDELMNRRRQYMIQRMTIAFSLLTLAAAGFGFYMYQSRNQIKTNYMNSMRNQSKYLANESMHLLDDEQRITALQLALEALPKGEEDERPVTPEAIRAITDASLAYVCDTPSNIFAEWVYRLPDSIDGFDVAPDGKSLAAYDYSGNLAVWNTATHETVLYNALDNVLGVQYTSDSILIIWHEDNVSAYNPITKKTLWTYKTEEKHFYSSSFVGTSKDYLYMYRAKDYALIKISLANGSEAALYTLPFETNASETDSLFSSASIDKIAVSPDETKVAYIASPDWEKSLIYVYDISTNKAVHSNESTDYIKDLYWAGNDYLLTASAIDISGSSMAMSGIEIVSPDHKFIQCFSPTDLKEKWNFDFTCTDTAVNSGFLYLPQNETVCYYSGNIADIYDLKTGERLNNYNANNSIVDISDNDENGIPAFITKNGKYASPISSDPNGLSLSTYFSSNILEAEICDGVYTKKNNNEIIFYGLHVYDNEWRPLGTSDPISNTSNFTITDNALGIFQEENDGNYYLYIYDLNDFNGVQKALLGDATTAYGFNYQIVYSDKSNLYVIENTDNALNLLSVSIANGKVSREPISDNGRIPYNVIPRVVGGCLIFEEQDADFNNSISVYDLKNKIKRSYPLPEESSSVATASPMYFAESNVIIFADKDHTYFINIETNTTKEIDLPDDWNGTTIISPNSYNGNYLITDKMRVLLIKEDGSVGFIIDPAGLTPNGICFYNDGNPKSEGMILVTYDKGTLGRYSITDGHFLGSTEIGMVSFTYRESEFDFDNENNLLYITTTDYVDVIDTEYWVEIASLAYCMGHHKPTDRFISYSTQNSTNYIIGYFEHYSVEHLIEKSHEVLHGAELSDELKSEYGISDDE